MCTVLIERVNMSAWSRIWGTSSKAWLTRLMVRSLQVTTGAPSHGSFLKSVTFSEFSHPTENGIVGTERCAKHFLELSMDRPCQHACINAATKFLFFSLDLFSPECARLLRSDVTAHYTKCELNYSFIVLHISNRKRTAFRLIYGSPCLLVDEGRYSPNCQNLLHEACSNAEMQILTRHNQRLI